MSEKLILYDLCGKNDIRFSPPCWNVKLCLINKKIDFITVPVSFTEKSKIKFSGQRLVPIVKFKNDVIFDSWKIIIWLEENFSKIRLIHNEQTKIFSHFLYYWTSKHILPLIFQIIGPDIPKILSPPDAKYFIESRENNLKQKLSNLRKKKKKINIQLNKSLLTIEKILNEKEFLNGNSPGLPDFIFFGNFMWAEKCSTESIIDEGSNIFKWYNRIKFLNNL